MVAQCGARSEARTWKHSARVASMVDSVDGAVGVVAASEDVAEATMVVVEVDSRAVIEAASGAVEEARAPKPPCRNCHPTLDIKARTRSARRLCASYRCCIKRHGLFERCSGRRSYKTLALLAGRSYRLSLHSHVRLASRLGHTFGCIRITLYDQSSQCVAPLLTDGPVNGEGPLIFKSSGRVEHLSPELDVDAGDFRFVAQSSC